MDDATTILKMGQLVLSASPSLKERAETFLSDENQRREVFDRLVAIGAEPSDEMLLALVAIRVSSPEEIRAADAHLTKFEEERERQFRARLDASGIPSKIHDLHKVL